MFGVEYYMALALSALLFVEVFRCSYEIRRDIYENESIDNRPNIVYHININVYSEDGDTSRVEVSRIVANAVRVMGDLDEANIFDEVEAFVN
jgi:hypothetical protein